MSYDRIKRALARVDREVRSGEMSLRTADLTISSLTALGVTPHDITENLSAEVLTALRAYAKGQPGRGAPRDPGALEGGSS